MSWALILFERSKTRVYPTPLGEQIVEQAQKVLEQAAAIRDLASSGKDQLNSPLSIGAIFTIGPYFIPALYPSIAADCAADAALHRGFTATCAGAFARGAGCHSSGAAVYRTGCSYPAFV